MWFGSFEALTATKSTTAPARSAISILQVVEFETLVCYACPVDLLVLHHEVHSYRNRRQIISCILKFLKKTVTMFELGITIHSEDARLAMSEGTESYHGGIISAGSKSHRRWGIAHGFPRSLTPIRHR